VIDVWAVSVVQEGARIMARVGFNKGSCLRLVMRVREPSQAQPQLHRIDAGVQRFQARVRDVHEANIRCPGQFPREVVHTDRPGRCKVDAGNSRGNLCVGKQGASAKFNVRYEAAVSVEVPNQIDRIYRGAIRRIRRLKKYEDRDRVHSVLESAAQETRAV